MSQPASPAGPEKPKPGWTAAPGGRPRPGRRRGARIGQRADHLQELGHRAGPAVRDQQRDARPVRASGRGGSARRRRRSRW